jgi:predicted kinase
MIRRFEVSKISQKAVGAVLSDKAGKHLDRIPHETGAAADIISRAASCCQFHETSDVFGSDLHPQRCP